MLNSNDRPTTRLRALLARPGCVVAPGVADAFAARLVALEGFEAIYMTGFGTSLTRLGLPDVGLLTASEMVDNAYRIADASGLPDAGPRLMVSTSRTISAIASSERASPAGGHACSPVTSSVARPAAGTVTTRWAIAIPHEILRR